ncbi:MAG: motility associated factor glycosyltransferase family protein [Planctomycetota bacterium]
MASLRGVVPTLAGAVDGAEPLPGAERIQTRDGDWTLRIARADGTATTLHSRYDPKREAAKLVGEVDAKGLQGFLVMGFGLGYHLQHLLAGSSEEAEVVVLEKDPAVIRAAAELRDLRAVFADRRVTWLVGCDRREVYRALRVRQKSLMSTDLRIVAHPPSTALAPEGYYQEARRAIRDFIMSGEISLRTNFDLARKSVRNEFLNLPLYVGEPSLAELREIYRGRPGIVVSAGPSLARNIDGLRAARGKAVLICCDVVLKPLLERGVVPDFTGIVDFQGHTAKFFETLPGRTDTRLVAVPAAYSGTVQLYPGPRAFAGEPMLDGFLGSARRDMGGYVASGGNVGQFSYSIAGVLGLDPVAFVGQDLAFPHNITHLGGTPIHEEWQTERNRFFTLEMRELEHLMRRRSTLKTVEDHDGNRIYTERSFYHYLRELELAIKSAKHRTVDCTEGGSRKEGAEVMRLADFLAECPEGEVPDPGAGPRELDRGRLAAAAGQLDDRVMEFLEVKAALEQKLRTHRRIERALTEDEPIEGYVRTLMSMEDRAKSYPEVLGALHALTPGGFFRAAKDDRRLAAAGAEGGEKIQAQFERDDRLVKQLVSSVRYFEPLLRGARRECRRLAEGDSP